MHLSARRVEIETALAQSGGSDRSGAIVSAAQLSAALPADTVLVDFLAYPRFAAAQRDDRGEVTELGGWGGDELVAWVLRPGAENAQRVELGPVTQMDAAVKEVLETVVNGSAAEWARCGPLRRKHPRHGRIRRGQRALADDPVGFL